MIDYMNVLFEFVCNGCPTRDRVDLLPYEMRQMEFYCRFTTHPIHYIPNIYIIM